MSPSAVSEETTHPAAVDRFGPPGDVLARTIRARWEAALRHLPGSIEHSLEDSRQIHKLRVATRRLVAALDLLGEHLDLPSRQKLRRMARRIRRHCGPARQLDVERAFFESQLPHASLEDAAVIEFLCQRAVRRRAKRQPALVQKLRRYERTLVEAGAEFLAAADDPETGIAAGLDAGGYSPGGALLELLQSLWFSATRGFESPRSLHALRVACKRVRYTAELCFIGREEKFERDFLPQLVHLQELLGECHDAAEMHRELLRLRRKWRKRRNSKKWKKSRLATLSWRDLRHGLDNLELTCTQRAEQARVELVDFWPGFSGESFRLPFERWVETLVASPGTTADRRPDGEPSSDRGQQGRAAEGGQTPASVSSGAAP